MKPLDLRLYTGVAQVCKKPKEAGQLRPCSHGSLNVLKYFPPKTLRTYELTDFHNFLFKCSLRIPL